MEGNQLPSYAAAPKQTSALGFFNQLPPSVALIVGLVGGLLILCSIGFFVLLSMMLKGQGIAMGAGNNNAGYVANQPTNDPNQVAPQPTGTMPALACFQGRVEKPDFHTPQRSNG
jgi:hypothetical protein